jgi:tRNA(fMet)-specific endonuclease VapC
MPYLLDTNAVIALMKNNPHVVEHMRQVGRSELVICAPVEAELWFGVCNLSRMRNS